MTITPIRKTLKQLFNYLKHRPTFVVGRCPIRHSFVGWKPSLSFSPFFFGCQSSVLISPFFLGWHPPLRCSLILRGWQTPPLLAVVFLGWRLPLLDSSILTGRQSSLLVLSLSPSCLSMGTNVLDLCYSWAVAISTARCTHASEAFVRNIIFAS